MRPWLDILIKPASGKCNLSCKYCFYEDVVSNRSTADRGFMSLETLETVVRKAFEEAKSGVTFGFQGGEPTLAGLDFYREFVKLCKKYNTKKLPADFTIQTNGTLLDGEWCGFLKEHNFLVGLSLDGDGETHDFCRCGTFEKVLSAADLLKKYGVPFNILCVVTNKNAPKAAEMYGFFKERGFEFLQFIPAIADFGKPQTDDDISLTAESYGSFLQVIFDCWFEDFAKGKYISIRHIDNWVGMLLGRNAESCAMRGVCNSYACIEADGTVYPCDFYVLDEHCLGNIAEQGFEELAGSAAAKAFEEASQSMPDECKNCPHIALCRGGCRRNRDFFGKNVFCQSYKMFFDAKCEKIKKAAEILQKGEIY